MATAGVTPAPGQEIHGQSLLPLLRGETFTRRAALHWENQQNAAVLDGEWKLVHRFWEPKPRLYRPLEDIGEDRDLAAQNPEKVAALLALHEQWKSRHYPNPVKRMTKRPPVQFPTTPLDP